MPRLTPWAIIAVAASALSLVACANNPSSQPMTPSEPTSSCDLLTADPGWYGDNRERIDAMITDLGECGGSGEAAQGAPLALFDWDNTVVKNDIGDAMTYWMLANAKLRQPAERNWAISPYLTTEAVTALNSACGSLAEPGALLPTDTAAGVACADEILSVYGNGKTTSDQKAFEGYNARRMEPQYAFAAQLLAGWAPEEIVDFADQARAQNLAAAEGTKQTIGTTEVTGWVRYYDQITNLISVLKAHGFDVRIISASAEPVAESWGAVLGLPAEKVMGAQTEIVDGKLTATLTGCGGDPASMPYIEGKRCRVNEEVLDIKGTAAFDLAPADVRQAFGAGDSDTDVTFMADATALRLVINRNKTELMCNAYANLDEKWIINPMFIEPKKQQTAPYACTTAGRILPDDTMGPLTDANGNPIPDQTDSVF